MGLRVGTAFRALTIVSAFALAMGIDPNGSQVLREQCSKNHLSLGMSGGVIGQGFIGSETTECLSIQNNGIYRVSEGAFDRIPNLRYLNLEWNRIPQQQLFSFGNLKSVKTLILSNQYRQWDHGSDNVTYVRTVYPQLQRLELRNTNVRQIRSSLSNPFPALRLLDLSANKIVQPNFLNLLPRSLTHLVLNGNSISRFSPVLAGLDGLNVLELNSNNIEVLGYNGLDLAGLRNLTSLSVAFNRIDLVRLEAFNDTADLRYLNLSQNALFYLNPEVLQNLKSLKVLVLDGNNLSELPFTSTMNLTTLSVKCNRLTQLKVDPMLHLPHLKKLHLGWNEISAFHPFVFRVQTLLEELYLNDNRLSYLPPGWNDFMDNLRLLDLSGNQFTLLYSVFQSPVQSLRYVYFERNPLKYIFTGALQNVPKNVTVYLREVPGRSENTCYRRPPVTTEGPSNTTVETAPTTEYWTTTSPYWSTASPETTTRGPYWPTTPPYWSTTSPEPTTRGPYWPTTPPPYWSTASPEPTTRGPYWPTTPPPYWSTTSPEPTTRRWWRKNNEGQKMSDR